MKMIVAALVALVSLQAEARSLHPETFTRVSDLTHFYVDPQLGPSMKSVESGYVSVNAVTKEVVLVLQPKWSCPAGQLCATYMPQPMIVRLPLLNFKKDERCGTVTYHAGEDKRMVDGNMEAITIVDNSMNKCSDTPSARIFPTVVTHKTVTAGMDGKVGRYNSKFYGTKLQNVGVPR